MKVGQPFEVFQSGIADFGVLEIEHLDVSQPFEVLQPRIGNLSATQV